MLKNCLYLAHRPNPKAFNLKIWNGPYRLNTKPLIFSVSNICYIFVTITLICFKTCVSKFFAHMHPKIILKNRILPTVLRWFLKKFV